MMCKVARRATWVVTACTLLGAFTWMGCDPGPPLPKVRRLRVKRVMRGYSAKPWRVLIQGQNLEHSARHRLGFELWRQKPAWPRVRVSLQRVRITGPGIVQAEVPAGVAPGRYRFVVRRGAKSQVQPHTIEVRDPKVNVGFPILGGLWSRRPASGEGGRLVVSGVNLLEPLLVTLHGPQRRLDVAGKPGKPAVAAAPPKVRVPGVTHRSRRERDRKLTRIKPRFGRLPIIELSPAKAATPTRFVVPLREDIPPGRYWVQVYTETHRGQHPEASFEVLPEKKGQPRVWSLAWLVLLFAIPLGLTVLFARPLRSHRQQLIWMGVILVGCLAPLALVL